MEHSDFDDALRDAMQSSEIPYEPQQWNLMAARLNGVQKPAQKRSIISLAHWAPAAVAACLVVMVTWYAANNQHAYKKNDREINIAGSTGKGSAQNIEKFIPAGINHNQATDRTPQTRTAQIPAVIAGSKAMVAASPVITNASIKPDYAVSSIILNKETGEPGRQIAAREKPQASLVNPQEPPELPQPKRAAFNLIGGYNIGNAKNNFTVGVTVGQKLSNKLRFETGIALVSGGYATHSEVVTISGFGTATTEYKAATASLLYLQAAPSLSYQVYKGFSAGGGVDAQRLLSDVKKTMIISDLGEAATPQPEWDFGLTGRMDYQVTERLRAGLMYRESIHAFSRSASDAARRNYLLLQLSYTIF